MTELRDASTNRCAALPILDCSKWYFFFWPRRQQLPTRHAICLPLWVPNESVSPLLWLLRFAHHRLNACAAPVVRVSSWYGTRCQSRTALVPTYFLVMDRLRRRYVGLWTAGRGVAGA